MSPLRSCVEVIYSRDDVLGTAFVYSMLIKKVRALDQIVGDDGRK
jgi:hypothetical protein